ncbi:hypothetical protein BSL78_02312 [Apostichopus japonicus]|uniref:NACHT domain-containing protein n=1 Tax=Stichopus japonicus TaxID=307972 RepID=A0A2G8LKG4_STIJA|nr:hypothetical protein BSL78_02312 [Apostichopus japonicus]
MFDLTKIVLNLLSLVSVGVSLGLFTLTVRPPDLCPVITGCGMPCTDCERIVNGSGELQCTIRGSRPGVPIEWTIKSQSFINLEKIENPPEYNETSQTWISTSIIKYITQGCGAKATLLCNGVQPFEILETPSSHATLRTELCAETTTIPSTNIPGRQSNWIWIFLVMLVFIIFIVIVIVIFTYRRRRRIRVSFPKTGEQYLPLSTNIGNFMRGNKETVCSKQQMLTSLLVESYRKFCFIKPLPWDEPIPTDALYTPCQCTVSHDFVRSNASNTNAHSSDDLSSPEFRKENKRVLLTADLGYGKTTFTQHLVQDWISEPSHSYVLVYVQLKDVKRQMSVADVLRNMLPQQDLLKTSDIEDVLRNADCLVLLDGLDELSISINLDVSRSSKTCASRDGGNEICESSTLTIGSLLENNTDMKYKNLKVWVTSRDVDDMNSLFSLPYTKVKLNGFSERNLDAYIEKTCKYICDIAANTGREKEIIALNSNLPEFQKKVTQSIAGNDIFEDFAKTPLLLIMIVHIIASRISNRNSRLREVDVNKLTTIIRMVITCLEARYVQKVDNELVQKDIQSLETELGRAAFQERGQILSRNREYWNNLLTKERTEMALSIGLLKLTKDVGVDNDGIKELAFSSHTCIEFYHEFFQDFFTAKFIAEKDNKGRLQYAIQDLSDDRTLTFLKFIFGLQKKGLKGACKVLANRGNMWNNLIDCMYEMTDMKEKVEIIKR